MANLDLQGQLRAELNHVPVITITRVSVDENLPGTVKKGGYGVIGIAEGIGDGSGSFTMSVPKAGMEIDVFALKASGARFTLSWTEGVSRLLASGCKITRVSRSNDPAGGDYSVSVSFIFGELTSF